MSNRLAVFDIDGTFFRSSLTIELTEALIHFEIFPPSARSEMAASKKAWQSRVGTYQKYIQDVVRVYEKNLKRVTREDITKVANLVLRKFDKHVYIYTRELIKKLKKDNYMLLAISGSPVEIMEQFIKRWGFTEGLGTVYQTDRKGNYTGKVKTTPIEDKKKVLKSYVRKNKISLVKSVGVGDTESDIPFLELVDTPICFNPNKKLYKIAKERGWQTVVERKDVVYKLHKLK